jgi:hypothetical protein
LRKVHRGHLTVVSASVEPLNSSYLASLEPAAPKSSSCGSLRLEAAAIAALRTTAKGGFIPQARHGGGGVETLAILGSKLEGTGLEKEQIGQIQVALFAGVDDRN